MERGSYNNPRFWRLGLYKMDQKSYVNPVNGEVSFYPKPSGLPEIKPNAQYLSEDDKPEVAVFEAPKESISSS